MLRVPLADVTLQQKDMLLVLDLARNVGSPFAAAAANEMMNACRGLGIDSNDFVVAHEVYRRLGAQVALVRVSNEQMNTWPSCSI